MKKILIACTLLLSLGSITNTPLFAQEKRSADSEMKMDKVDNETFIKVLKQYQSADNKDLEQKYLGQILNNMRIAMANSKEAIATASSSKDENKTQTAIKKQENQGALFNKLIAATKDENIEKVQIIRILKEFSTTL